MPVRRVVYADNPIVLGHARVLLTSSPEGATAYIDADLRATGTIPERAAGVLDCGQPVVVFAVDNDVHHLCKTALSLCTYWGNDGDSIAEASRSDPLDLA